MEQTHISQVVSMCKTIWSTFFIVGYCLKYIRIKQRSLFQNTLAQKGKSQWQPGRKYSIKTETLEIICLIRKMIKVVTLA